MTGDEESNAIVPSSPLADDSGQPERHQERASWGKYARLMLAVLGCIPWIGPFLGAGAQFWGEKAQDGTNDLHRAWLREHESKLKELERALRELTQRIDGFGARAQERVQAGPYLDLVRQGFRAWDRAPTNEKRRIVEQILQNAAGTEVSSDDVVRLFIDWVDKYHEIHFRVIAQVHAAPGITRSRIWRAVGGPTQPREDSPEADLFKLMIRDLSTGGVIRQQRETDYSGNFIKKKPTRRAPSDRLASAFDDEDGYELTALGVQFVHYALTEAVPRVGR